MTRTFRVWAPRAREVALVLNGERSTMEPAANGWFTCDRDAATGAAYAFSLDGGPPRPDPRSLWQPDGVHGASRVVDHGAFAWSDETWRGLPLRQALMYELHVGTFTPAGTLDSAVLALDHLVELGVNAVELMPVAEFAGDRGWGYDGVDLFAVHHAYGGPDALKRLVDACHARGLAVVMDVVYNHLGPEGNYLGEYGPYFTERYATPWGAAVNYDAAGSDEVRTFVLDNVESWVRDYHCDGVRLDAVHAILDTSATHLLEHIADRVDALRDELGREVWVIAESDLNDPRLVRDRMLGGYGLHAQWSDSFHHALHAVLTGERAGYYVDFGALDQVCTALREAFVYSGQHSVFRGRRFGRPIGEMPLTRFVGYTQNHDQVGNRATGERLSHLVRPGRARIAAALTILSPFVPMLFMGEEWAASTPFQYFADLQDPGLRRAVAEGRRNEFRDFGWEPEMVPDPVAASTFAASRLRWEELDDPAHSTMLAWYRDLIALRRSTSDIAGAYPADIRASCDPERGVLVHEIAGLVVAANIGVAPARIGEADGAALLLGDARPGDGDAWLLPADGVAVWRQG